MTRLPDPPLLIPALGFQLEADRLPPVQWRSPVRGFIAMALCSFLCILALLAASGCSGQDPSDLFATAQFEERQNNREHAVQLYEQIIRDYPRSEVAQRARQRLEELHGRK
jgi:hypothetical protein